MATATTTAPSPPGASGGGRRRRSPFRRSLNRRYVITAYLFLLPAFAFFGLMFYLPIANVIANSFNTGPRADVFAGLDNYRRAFDDQAVHNAFTVTVIFGAATTIGAIVIGLGLALLLNQQLRGRVVFRAIVLVPYLTSVAIVGLLWRNILDPQLGVLNRVLTDLGLPTQTWLNTHPLATIVGVTLWMNVGYTMVLFLAGLQGIPEEYQEAATVDGASSWQRFWRITLPLLAPTTLFVSVMSVIGGLQAFGQAYIITGGGPAGRTDLYIFHVFEVAFTSRDFGYASALSFLLFLVIVLFTVVQLRAGRRGEVQY
ncbi:carbohydrate ABC transporter permease [Jiangella alkaliphila]|uniref:Carbohydrate ABC transporter membrane protein 1, CUT1 family n=1 Tax=Jiangella alkaliphila TaxID=419479 RepID=A0A1H2LEW7_9ACTN|nr:sugar ABC transporter permease [Jiangella alkaliphila]SDU79382.1 carbohydrate ABC transporter membrane protein 1, CUT1 family [Jiangella alkaliphila]